MEKIASNIFVRVQYDFVPAETNELGVREGETVRLHYECQGWYFVETTHGLKGYVPKTYCNIISNRAIQKSSSGSSTQNRYQKIKAEKLRKTDLSNGNSESDEKINLNRTVSNSEISKSNPNSPRTPEVISCGSYNSRTGLSRSPSIIQNGIRYYCREKDWRKPQHERKGINDQIDNDGDRVSNSDSNSELNNGLVLPAITYTHSSDEAIFRTVGEVAMPKVKHAKRVSGLLKIANSVNNEQTLDDSTRIEGRRNKNYFDEKTQGQNYMYLPLQKKTKRRFSSCEDIFKAYTSQMENRGIVVNDAGSDNEDSVSTRSAISSASIDDNYLDSSAERLRRTSCERVQRSVSMLNGKTKTYETCESIDNFLTSDTNACHTDSDSNRHSMDDDCDSGLFSESQSSETSDIRWSPPANYNYQEHNPPINSIDHGWCNSLRKKSQSLLQSQKLSGRATNHNIQLFKNVNQIDVPDIDNLQQGLSDVNIV